MLRADGTAVAVDLGRRAEESVTGTGTWSLIGGGVLLVIEDTNGLESLSFVPERSSLTIVLVEYIGDPDEGNGRLLVRDER